MIDDRNWTFEGGARWWVFESTVRARTYPFVYRREHGVVWRWNPAQAGTGAWVIEVMQLLEQRGWIARALRGYCPTLVGQEADRCRDERMCFDHALHSDISAIVAVVERRDSFESTARAVILAAESTAFERGDEWPLHLALAADRLRSGS